MTVSYTVEGTADKAVVFLHGVGSGKEGWALQAEPVLASGWKFIAVDGPGFGETPLPDQPGFKPHVDAVLDVMEKEGLRQAVLCGHSLGGMTAQEVYAHHPERVSGLVLSATSPAFGKADGDFQKSFLRARFEPFDQGMTMPEFAEKFSHNLLGPAPREGSVDEIIEVMSNVSIEAYRMAMNTLVQFDQRSNLPNINVPTLLISGEQDKNSPAKMMEKMASYIPNSVYEMLPNTGHMAPIENPDGFNDHLTNYLKRQTA